MSGHDPRRWNDPRSEAHPNLRALLVAGRAELPGPERVAQMAQRAGGELATPNTRSGRGGAGSAGAIGGMLVGALLAALGLAGYSLLRELTRTQPAVALPAPSVQPEPVRPSSTTAHPAALIPPPTLLSAEPATTRPRTSAPGARRVQSDPVAELELLDQAQEALRSGAPERALARANDHAARFPLGEYQQERELIATEALLRLGRHQAARRRATRLLTRFPDSSYRPRAEEQLDRAAQHAH